MLGYSTNDSYAILDDVVSGIHNLEFNCLQSAATTHDATLSSRRAQDLAKREMLMLCHQESHSIDVAYLVLSSCW